MASPALKLNRIALGPGQVPLLKHCSPFPVRMQETKPAGAVPGTAAAGPSGLIRPVAYPAVQGVNALVRR